MQPSLSNIKLIIINSKVQKAEIFKMSLNNKRRQTVKDCGAGVENSRPTSENLTGHMPHPLPANFDLQELMAGDCTSRSQNKASRQKHQQSVGNQMTFEAAALMNSASKRAAYAMAIE